MEIQKQSGLSLIELLVAITIGTLLTAGILQLMLITRQSYLLSTRLGMLMDNADIAIRALSQCAIQAGHQSTYYTESAINNFQPNKLWFGCFRDLPGSPIFHEVITTTPTGMPSSLTNCIARAADRHYTTIGFATTSARLPGQQNICFGGNNGDPLRNNRTGCSNSDAVQIYFLRGSGTRYSASHFTGVRGTDNDTLVISFEGKPDNLSIDCLGNVVEPNILAVNRFEIQNDTAGNPYLSCTVTRINISTSETVSQPSQPIAYGVESFRVLYGIDTDDDGAPNQYRNASFFTSDTGAMRDMLDNPASDSSARVVGITVALLMRTEEGTSSTMDTTSTYTLLDNPVIGPFNDKRLRRLFTTTLKTNECIPSTRQDCGPGTEFYGYYNSSDSNVNFSFAGFARPGTDNAANVTQVVWSRPQQEGSNTVLCGCQMDASKRLWAWKSVNGVPTASTAPVSFYHTHNPQGSMQTTPTKASIVNACICAFR